MLHPTCSSAGNEHDLNFQPTKSAILEYKPHLIIASSWGGAIAYELLKHGIWRGPTILLCPAQLKIQCLIEVRTPGDHRRNGGVLNGHRNGHDTLFLNDTFLKEALTVTPCHEENYQLLSVEPEQKWLIFHGLEDDVININDSRLAVKCNPDRFELTEIKHDGHRLKHFVVSKQLNEVVRKYMKL